MPSAPACVPAVEIVRVLHVIPAVAARYGGPSAAVAPMCDALAGCVIETLIVATNADGDQRLNVAVGQRTSWQGTPAIFFERNFSESFKYSSGLASWLRDHVADFDIVHIHAVLSHACLAAAAACRAKRVPYILRPLGTLAPWSLRQKAFRKRITLALGARRAILSASAVHCTSLEEQHGIEQEFSGARAVVIPLGIDAAVLEASTPSWADRNRDRYVLSISRLHAKKNLETLIRAFVDVAARTQDAWRLVIAGSGEPDYVDRLQQFAKAHDRHGRVQFAGWVDGPQKRELLQRASLFALASLHENFGISVLEALASGVPAILSGEVDLAAAVRLGHAGWVVDPTAESLVLGLQEALGNDAERASRGQAARALASRYAWPGVAAELVDLYRRLQTDRAALGNPILSSAATGR